jgi:hypothetical protein
VAAAAPRHPHMDESAPANTARASLNRIPPRGNGRPVDFLDFSACLSDLEHAESDRAIQEAVAHASRFVQARQAMRARD